jgi:uncharacterized protein YndB with AHSA1/START domain
MGTLVHSGTTEVVVDAAPEAVWALASDPTRVGEWSHECFEARWLEGATRAVPGARFQGRNKVGRVKWGRTSEIVEVDAPNEIAWRTVPTRMYPDSTEWRLRVEPCEQGTRIVQRFEVLKLNPIMERIIYVTMPVHRDRIPALTEDLRRLGTAAAR